jgi:REP element-mobilizing transposase RayT
VALFSSPWAYSIGGAISWSNFTNDLRAVFIYAHSGGPFRFDAIAVLPHHLHCIWSLPPYDADFSTRWHDINSRFLREYLAENGSRHDAGRKASAVSGSGVYGNTPSIMN